MSAIIHEPTTMATWHRMIIEASADVGTELDEDTESYVVFLMMRYLRRTDLLRTVLAMDFLHALQQQRRRRHETLRDVGDKCLVLTGLFPGQARRRRVRLSYFVDLGRSAYDEVAESGPPAQSAICRRLAATFVAVSDVLRALRGREHLPLMDVAEAFERHVDTGSALAASCLLEYTDATPISGGNQRH